jgi:AcrR family transcriptional regulator
VIVNVKEILLAGSRKGARGGATKARIVDAATRLFLEDGYVDTTVAAIAAEAGVAVQTLYLSFGSKMAILRAAHDVAVVGDDAPIPVLERPWVGELHAEPDGRRALRLVIENGLQIIERVTPIMGVIQAAAADADVAALLDDVTAGRLITQQAFARELAAKKGFKRSLPSEDVADLLYALLSPDLYRLLVIERHWSTPDLAGFIDETLATRLFRN